MPELSAVYKTTYPQFSTSSGEIKESTEATTKAKVEKSPSYYQSEDPFLDIKSPQSETGMVSEDPEG